MNEEPRLSIFEEAATDCGELSLRPLPSMATDSSRCLGHILFHPSVCMMPKQEKVTNPTSLHKIVVEVHDEKRDLKSEFKELQLKV